MIGPTVFNYFALYGQANGQTLVFFELLIIFFRNDDYQIYSSVWVNIFFSKCDTTCWKPFQRILNKFEGLVKLKFEILMTIHAGYTVPNNLTLPDLLQLTKNLPFFNLFQNEEGRGCFSAEESTLCKNMSVRWHQNQKTNSK